MKLININIEGEKHFDRVIPFLTVEQPDVLCLQEVFKIDLPRFESLGYSIEFLPITRALLNTEPEELGIALAVNTKYGDWEHIAHHYYRKPDGEIREYHREDKYSTVNNAVLIGTLRVNRISYAIGTTHFTWVPDGSIPNEYQKDDMVRFLAYMKTLPSHCVTGDFNIPRHHNPLYNELIKNYSDAIPESYTSSLDKNIHRLGNNGDKNNLFTDYMVDHLLTQEPYLATDVRLEFGISDHAAIVATVEKRN